VLIEAASRSGPRSSRRSSAPCWNARSNPKERAKLGAHYTPRAYVERLIMPTIMEPLRADWDGVRGAAACLIEGGQGGTRPRPLSRRSTPAGADQGARSRLRHRQFPLCRDGADEGAGRRSARPAGRAGRRSICRELTGHTITPENFLGIEINPRAAAIAQLVLWIGYLQWHFKVNGEGPSPARTDPARCEDDRKPRCADRL
jgi:hypothetical protein